MLHHAVLWHRGGASIPGVMSRSRQTGTGHCSPVGEYGLELHNLYRLRQDSTAGDRDIALHQRCALRALRAWVCRLDQDGIYWDVPLRAGTPRFLGLLVHAGETKSARE
jgi:hypothetical protein